VAKQIVTRANQSIGEFGPIFEPLGMDGGVDHAKIQANMDARCDATDAGAAQREALRAEMEFKKYAFDCHGVEMNQRYTSGAIVTDGQAEPAYAQDRKLHDAPTTWPGARLPHVWVFDAQWGKHSTLDLCGHGQFTLLTGIGGDAWIAAEEALSASLGLPIRMHKIGPRCAIADHTGDWARGSEIADAGCLLVRPDHHVAWCSFDMTTNPQGDLARVLHSIVGH
jgi:2,4-dichlorophenol 6-monooxygenase